MNKVSIIVPIYNVECYLERCVNSLMNQTYRNIEIILVNDNSTDLSGDICDKYSHLDSRIKVLHNNKNGGCVFARKEGIKVADGKYIIFCDSDDYIEEISVETMISKMEETDADIVICGYYLDKNGMTKKQLNYFPNGLYSENKDIIYQKMMFDFDINKPAIIQSNCAKLFKKEILEEILLKEEDRITLGEDAACVYPYLLNSKKICIYNECFYHYCTRENSMCTQHNMELFSQISFFESYLNNFFTGYSEEYRLKEQLQAYLIHFIEMAIHNNFGITYSKQYGFREQLFQLLYKKRVVIYGAGKVGKQLHYQICRKGMIENVGWVDKNIIGQEIDGETIVSLQDCLDKDFDYVVVAVLREEIFNEIKTDISKYIKEQKIIWADPFEKFGLRKIELKGEF